MLGTELKSVDKFTAEDDLVEPGDQSSRGATIEEGLPTLVMTGVSCPTLGDFYPRIKAPSSVTRLWRDF